MSPYINNNNNNNNNTLFKEGYTFSQWLFYQEALLYKYYNETIRTKWQYTQNIYNKYTQLWDKNHRLEMMCLNKFCLNDASEGALLKFDGSPFQMITPEYCNVPLNNSFLCFGMLIFWWVLWPFSQKNLTIKISLKRKLTSAACFTKILTMIVSEIFLVTLRVPQTTRKFKIFLVMCPKKRNAGCFVRVIAP